MNRAAVTAAGLVLVASIAHGQPASEPPRRGGLLPDRVAEPSLQFRSRDELARQWDLNADGTIDESEAEVARSKMRRQRLEFLQKRQSSPLPKPPEDTAPVEDELTFPDPSVAPPSTVGAKTDTAPTQTKSTGESATKPPAPAKRDLNAGRLPAGFPPARGIPPGTVPPGRVGISPGSQPPSTPTGMRRAGPMVPPTARATPQSPIARPAPTGPARPRVTAEEMGGP